MNPVQIPWILKKTLTSLTWEMDHAVPALYLTFDDGPTPGITAEVLSILDQYNAKATFFCIGRNAERYPDIFKKMVANGHAAGNHTYSHLKGWYTRNWDYFNDIALAARFVPSHLFRPAYGMMTPSQVRYLKRQYRIVLWSIMSYDFDLATSPERCLSHVLKHARPGSVIVFHDSLKASEKVLYALPRVLEHFSGKSYEFNSILDQILTT
jgi:peptidoglycan-N-acetylglucosamine deacetylase